MPSDTGEQLALYASEPHECSYLDGRRSTLHYLDPAVPLDPGLYAALLHQGFRRSGAWVYRPGCAGCRHCTAARIPVARFTPNRSQRRTTSRNSDLSLTCSPAELTQEHYELYLRYIGGRHPGGGMEDASLEECRSFLLADWCETWFVDLRLGNRLVSTAVTDVLPGALSSVYTFFDPDQADRGLGTYSIIAQIEQARQRSARHLYLGYWVPGSAKMEYKSRFRALELFGGKGWTLFESGARLPVPP